jgi:transcription termination/antitermination protein NusG
MTEISDNGKWYVVHTYSGHENKVKANLEKLVENRGMQDIIFSVNVPTEEYTENKSGKQKTKERKMFPGYVLVKMLMTDESWYLVRNTRGVTGFVGPGSKPIPLSDEEVKNLGVQEKLPQVDVIEGETIRVKSGPFENLEGVIEEIDSEKRKIKAYVSMFGRDTLVELDFEQFEKIY